MAEAIAFCCKVNILEKNNIKGVNLQLYLKYSLSI